jgi:hypothetical protein
MATQTYFGTLTVLHCYKCGVPFGLDAGYVTERRNDHQNFYCPNGHAQGYHGPSAAERERDAALRDAAWWKEREQSRAKEAEAAKRSAAASRGVVTKMKRRLGKGVCPCCKRYFADLHRHVQGQHPEFVAADA